MALTYRSVKGSALTIKELDDNFRHFTGSQAITGSITANSFSGSFSGSFEGDGTNITGITATLPSGVISGSAQITEFGFVSQSGGIVDLPNVKIQYANVYSDLTDLPAAANYHGMFAHVHATGKGYYAHGGAWIELANASGSVATASYVEGANVDGIVSSATSATTALTASFVSSSFEMLSPNGTRYAFTINDSGHLSLTGSAV